MNLIPQKLHRRIEKALQTEKGCLKEQVQDLKKMGKSDQQILEAATGAVQWMQMYNERNFIAVFSLYTSCLKNPKEGGSDASPNH